MAKKNWEAIIKRSKKRLLRHLYKNNKSGNNMSQRWTLISKKKIEENTNHLKIPIKQASVTAKIYWALEKIIHQFWKS